ncbi:MAG: hypothetical protein RNU03_13135 [Candidatus Sedimenticola sp. (ex Thyasira tokunagai)]
MDIEVRVFGNSYTAVSEIECKIYTGEAVYQKYKNADVSKCTLIDTLRMPKLDALSRQAFTLKNQKLSKNTVITVTVSHDELGDINQKCYWGIYSYENFAESVKNLASQKQG